MADNTLPGLPAIRKLVAGDADLLRGLAGRPSREVSSDAVWQDQQARAGSHRCVRDEQRRKREQEGAGAAPAAIRARRRRPPASIYAQLRGDAARPPERGLRACRGTALLGRSLRARTTTRGCREGHDDAPDRAQRSYNRRDRAHSLRRRPGGRAPSPSSNTAVGRGSDRPSVRRRAGRHRIASGYISTPRQDFDRRS
jgi:hypothetical protein